MRCPKCNHVRPANSDNPSWQCPACGIAYNKFARAKAAVTPLTADAPAPSALADTSVWGLIATNLVAIIIALWQGWSLAELMLIYLAQSIIIGCSYVARILSLEKFSTHGFRINGRSVEPTNKTKRQTAFFFLIHFGIFHLAYLAFIIAESSIGIIFDLGFLICTAAFAVNHWFSYRYHLQQDRRGTPNIGTLMFTPYLRIVPMHITIILGATLATGTGILLFGLLKTVADALMHVVEHKALGRANE